MIKVNLLRINEILKLRERQSWFRRPRKNVKGVNGIWIIDHLLFFSVSIQSFTVSLLPVSQWIKPSDEHHTSREIQSRYIVRFRSEHIRRRMVSVRSLRQKRVPAPVRSLHRHQRISTEQKLRLRSLFSSEIWLYQHASGYFQVQVVVLASPRNDVVDDIATGAVAQGKASA